MSLWGKSPDAVDNKPKHLNDAEKRDAYATNSGWTVPAGGNGNPAADREVLVAIRGLAGTSATTGLREATITDVRFVIGSTATTDLTAGGGASITAEITWDEAVTIAGGNPTMTIANGNESTDGNGNYVLAYTSVGSTANRKIFTLSGQTLSAADVLSLGTALHDSVVLPGGVTIKDTASGTVNSKRSIAASVRTTHTVVA